MIIKRKNAIKTDADRRLIARNAGKIDVIAAYCAQDKTELNALKEELKYLIPSETDAAIEWENKISDMIDDFKLEVSTKHSSTRSVTDFVVEVQAAIAERNSRV